MILVLAGLYAIVFGLTASAEGPLWGLVVTTAAFVGAALGAALGRLIA